MGQGRVVVVAGLVLLAGILAGTLLLLEDGDAADSPSGADAPLLLADATTDRRNHPTPLDADAGQDNVSALQAELPEVAPDPASHHGHAWLDPRGLRSQRIIGRVVDEEGRPVAEAAIHLVPESNRLGLALAAPDVALDEAFATLPARSQADGRFALVAERLPGPGDQGDKAYLLVTAEGLAREWEVVPVDVAPVHDVGDVELEPGGALTGRVVDEGGRPLGGVEVLFRSSNVRLGNYSWRPHPVRGAAPLVQALGERLTTVRSAADGRFRLDGLEGHGEIVMTWKGSPEVRGERLRVEPEQGERDVGDLLLPLGRALAGRVTDDAGRPLPGARVHLTAEQPPAGELSADDALGRAVSGAALRGVVCDGDGRFRVEGLASAVYSLYALAPGHLTARLDGLSPGEHDLTLALTPVVPWGVVLVDDELQPVAEAELDVRTEDWRSALAPLAGLARVPPEPLQVQRGEPPGSWLVAGLSSDLARLTARADGLGAREVPAAGLELDEVGRRRLVLQRLGSLSGTVTSGPERRPVPAARVALQPAEELTPRTAQRMFSSQSQPIDGLEQRQVAHTDELGRYRFDDVPHGTWQLHVQAEHFLAYEGRVGSEVEDVTLDADQPEATLDVSLHRAAVVSGVVIEHDGTPREGTSVRLKAGSLREQRGSRRTRTDAEGRFRFEQLAAGAYTVWSVYLPEEIVDVRPGPEVELQFVLPPPAVVSGVARFADGAVDDGRVRMWVADVDADAKQGARDQRLSRSLDDQGRFQFELQAEGTTWFRGYGPAGQPSDEVELEVTPGGSYSLELSWPDTLIAGQVVEVGSGKPLEGARIHLRGGGTPGRLSLRSDGAGRFAVPGVSPGSWKLSASLAGYEGGALDEIVVVDPDAPPADDGMPTGDASAGEVTGDAAGPSDRPAPDALRVVLAPQQAKAGLVGSVFQADGTPAYDGTSVQARLDGGSSWGGRRANVKAGRYELGGLDPGAWTLTVSRPVVQADGGTRNVELFRQEVTLQPGEQRGLDVQLAEPPPPEEPSETDEGANLLELLQTQGYFDG